MQFWFEHSEKEKNTAYVGAEHEGVTGFAALRFDGRELAHAAGALAAAALSIRSARKLRRAYRAAAIRMKKKS